MGRAPAPHRSGNSSAIRSRVRREIRGRGRCWKCRVTTGCAYSSAVGRSATTTETWTGCRRGTPSIAVSLLLTRWPLERNGPSPGDSRIRTRPKPAKPRWWPTSRLRSRRDPPVLAHRSRRFAGQPDQLGAPSLDALVLPGSEVDWQGGRGDHDHQSRQSLREWTNGGDIGTRAFHPG